MQALLLLAVAFAAQDKAPEKCTLSGTVVSAVTGEPLSKVDLVLRSSGRTTGTVTDSAGRFQFTDLAPGASHLTGRRSGYLETAYGSSRPDGEGAVIRLAEGQSIAGLKFKMLPFGVIAGTIRDSDGEPLAGAYVTVVRLTWVHGKRRMEFSAGVRTDDLGQYRVVDLAPGKYYVGARPHAVSGPQPDSSAGVPGERTVPTAYPGVTELSLAAPIAVAAGARVTGIDISLARVRTFSVKGRAVNAAGAPVNDTAVVLRNRDSGLDFDAFLYTSTRGPNGAFELRVPAGLYRLSVRDSETQLGARPLEVFSNLEGIVAMIAAPGRVSGKYLAEGDGDLAAVHFAVLLSSDGRPDFFIGAGNRPFQHNDIAPGLYQLHLNGGAKNLYVKSIRSGDTDVLAEGLTVPSGGAAEVEILLSRDGGKVEGVVLDAHGQAVDGAIVLLAPKIRRRVDLFQSATTDQYGKFEFTAVAPGDYTVFAWEDVEPGIWHDPEFLKPIEKKGEPVTVKPKSSAVVKPPLIQ